MTLKRNKSYGDRTRAGKYGSFVQDKKLFLEENVFKRKFNGKYVPKIVVKLLQVHFSFVNGAITLSFISIYIISINQLSTLLYEVPVYMLQMSTIYLMHTVVLYFNTTHLGIYSIICKRLVNS